MSWRTLPVAPVATVLIADSCSHGSRADGSWCDFNRDGDSWQSDNRVSASDSSNVLVTPLLTVEVMTVGLVTGIPNDFSLLLPSLQLTEG